MEFKELFENFLQSGSVSAISIRPKRLAPVNVLQQIYATQDIGLDGDRYNSKGGARQVTFIQEEHLKTIGAFLNKEIDFTLTRRNILVCKISLLALKGKRFKIGEAVFEYSGECHPCSRMEENLGYGGYNAMRGLGGITARVLQSGVIKIGDTIHVISAPSA